MSAQGEALWVNRLEQTRLSLFSMQAGRCAFSPHRQKITNSSQEGQGTLLCLWGEEVCQEDSLINARKRRPPGKLSLLTVPTCNEWITSYSWAEPRFQLGLKQASSCFSPVLTRGLLECWKYWGNERQGITWLIWSHQDWIWIQETFEVVGVMGVTESRWGAGISCLSDTLLADGTFHLERKGASEVRANLIFRIPDLQTNKVVVSLAVSFQLCLLC